MTLAHLLAAFARSALCPLLSRFIRCTDDYRKPHLRSPTLIASPSSSSCGLPLLALTTRAYVLAYKLLPRLRSEWLRYFTARVERAFLANRPIRFNSTLLSGVTRTVLGDGKVYGYDREWRTANSARAKYVLRACSVFFRRVLASCVERVEFVSAAGSAF